jgi:hypothetical protein
MQATQRESGAAGGLLFWGRVEWARAAGHGEESGEARRRLKAKNGAAAARSLLRRSAVELVARRGSEVVAATSDNNAREELVAGISGRPGQGAGRPWRNGAWPWVTTSSLRLLFCGEKRSREGRWLLAAEGIRKGRAHLGAGRELVHAMDVPAAKPEGGAQSC